MADLAIFVDHSLDDDAFQAVVDPLYVVEPGKRGRAFVPGVLGVQFDYVERAVYVNLEPGFDETFRSDLSERLSSAWIHR